MEINTVNESQEESIHELIYKANSASPREQKTQKFFSKMKKVIRFLGIILITIISTELLGVLIIKLVEYNYPFGRSESDLVIIYYFGFFLVFILIGTLIGIFLQMKKIGLFLLVGLVILIIGIVTFLEINNYLADTKTIRRVNQSISELNKSCKRLIRFDLSAYDDKSENFSVSCINDHEYNQKELDKNCRRAVIEYILKENRSAFPGKFSNVNLDGFHYYYKLNCDLNQERFNEMIDSWISYDDDELNFKYPREWKVEFEKIIYSGEEVKIIILKAEDGNPVSISFAPYDFKSGWRNNTISNSEAIISGRVGSKRIIGDKLFGTYIYSAYGNNSSYSFELIAENKSGNYDFPKVIDHLVSTINFK